MARHIKTGDTVIVISGADKGKTGKVLRILTDRDRVVVEGVNRVWKHVRPSQRNPQGGRIQKAGKGGFAGGRIPFGYASDGKGGLAIDERHRATVTRIYAENGDGRTLQAIADGLNRDGIPSPTGKRWWPSSVTYVLNNQVYAGKVEYVFVSGGVVTHVNRPGDHARLVR